MAINKLNKETFLALLQDSAPAAVEFAEWVLDEAPLHGMTIEWGGNGPLLKFSHPKLEKYPKQGKMTVAQLHKKGKLDRGKKNLFNRCQAKKFQETLAPIVQTYLTELAGMIPGAKCKTFQKGWGKRTVVVYGDDPGFNDLPPLELLAPHGRRWFAAIDSAISAITKTLDQSDVGENGGNGKNAGGGFEPDAKIRQAIERRAMKIAIRHFEQSGYTVKDTSAKCPYDLECRRAKSVFRVEVKGSRYLKVPTAQLTLGEVENARNEGVRTDLFVVGGIVIQKGKGRVRASGGQIVRHIESWVPHDSDLKATHYTYNIPEPSE